MNNYYAPTTRSARLDLLDILRGIAIFGVFMVNVAMMYQSVLSPIVDVNKEVSTFQIACESFVSFLFEGKFYIMFSLLFGYGSWMFMNKKTESGKSIIPIFRRRLFFLLLTGLCHVIFLWAGDILVAYALWGFVLILFRNSSNKELIVWSVVFVLLPLLFLLFSVLVTSLMAMAGMTGGVDSTAMIEGIVENAISVYSTGTYSEIMVVRLQEYALLLPFFYTVPMGMFLIGIIVAKKAYISNWSENITVIRKTFWWSLGIGIISNIIYTIVGRFVNPIDISWSLLLMQTMYTIGGIAFAFCYGSGAILLYAKIKTNYLFNLLASTGRMALSNYLCQSIIVAILIYPFGFGLFGKFETWQGILLAFFVFTIQMFISHWWLKKFYFGPFEWLWKSLTYWRVQPLLRK